MDPAARAPDSTLGRLLQELSWVGSNIRAYRNGGLGFENVLTAEVLTVLDYLPRRGLPRSCHRRRCRGGRSAPHGLGRDRAG